MIYINGRFLTQPLTGVNRFSYEMVKAMRDNGYKFTLICPKQGVLEEYDLRDFRVIYYGIGKSHFWELFILPFYFYRKKHDILISFSGLGPLFVRNKVTTIHDLAHRVNPKWYALHYRIFYRFMEPLVARTCRCVLTVSEFSKSEIIKYYSFIKPDNIHVIYNACSQDWKLSEAVENITDKHDYMLCVSSIDPRKNFPILLEAFRKMPGIRLKVVGGKNAVFGNNVFEIPNNVEFIGRVTDLELAILYHNARAFIYPTLYEGFGLPPIEAAHFGCPVVVSDIPVLREVCANSASYFNPHDVNSIVGAVTYAINMSEDQRSELIADARQNARRFSWGKSAEKLIQILEQFNDNV